PSPTRLYTLSLHDALPISLVSSARPRIAAIAAKITPISSIHAPVCRGAEEAPLRRGEAAASDGVRTRWRQRQAQLDGVPADPRQDRKSTRLNSSHVKISYA